MIQKDKEYNYYHGLRDFIKEKSILDMDMVFERYPNEIFPLILTPISLRRWSVRS